MSVQARCRPWWWALVSTFTGGVAAVVALFFAGIAIAAEKSGDAWVATAFLLVWAGALLVTLAPVLIWEFSQAWRVLIRKDKATPAPAAAWRSLLWDFGVGLLMGPAILGLMLR